MVSGTTTLTLYENVVNGLNAASVWPDFIGTGLASGDIAEASDKILFILRTNNMQEVRVAGYQDTTVNIELRLEDENMLTIFSIYAKNNDITSSDNTSFVFVEDVSGGDVVTIPTLDFDDPALPYTADIGITFGATAINTLDKVSITTGNGNINNAFHLANVNALVVSGTTTLTLYENVVNALYAAPSVWPDFIGTGLASGDIAEASAKILFILRTDDTQEVRVAGYQDTTVDIELRLENEGMLTTFSIYAKHATIGNSANTSFVFVEDVSDGDVKIIPTLRFTDQDAYPGTNPTLAGRDKVSISGNTRIVGSSIANVNAIEFASSITTVTTLAIDDAEISALTPASPNPWPTLHANIDATDDILFVLRGNNTNHKIQVTGLMKATPTLLGRVDDETSLTTFNIYSTDGGIVTGTANEEFLFVEVVSSDDGVSSPATLTITNHITGSNAYDGSANVSGGSAMVDMVDISSSSSEVVFNGDHFDEGTQDVEIINLATAPSGGVTLVVTATEIDKMATNAISGLHTDIDTTSDRVLIVLRDASNQGLSIPGLEDTGETVYRAINGVVRALRVYSENEAIADNGNDAFLLVEELDGETGTSTTQPLTVTDVTMGEDLVAYTGSTVTGTAGQIDTVVPGMSATLDVDGTHFTNVEGLNLGGHGGITVTIAKADVDALDEAAGTAGLNFNVLVFDDGMSYISATAKVMLILRDNVKNQQVHIETGLVNINKKISVLIGGEEVTFSVYSEDTVNLTSNTTFLLVQDVDASDAGVFILTTLPFTHTRTTYTGMTTGATNMTTDMVSVSSGGTPMATDLTNTNGIDMTGAGTLTLYEQRLTSATAVPTALQTALNKAIPGGVVGSTDKVLIVQRDMADEKVRLVDLRDTGDANDIRAKIKIGMADATAVKSFSVYTQNRDITASANAVFVLVEDVANTPVSVVPTINAITFRANDTGATAGALDGLNIATDTTPAIGALDNINAIDITAANTTVTLNETTLDDIDPASAGVWPDFHESIDEDSDIIFFIIRNMTSEKLDLYGLTQLDGEDATMEVRTGGTNTTTISTFSVYSQNPDIADANNDVFVFVQHFTGSTPLDGTRSIHTLTLTALQDALGNDVTYTGSTISTSGTSGTINTVKATLSATPLTLDAAHLTNIEGLDLSGQTGSAPLVVSKEAINGLDETAGDLGLDALPYIGEDDKVLLILRDNVSNQLVRAMEFIDRGRSLNISIGGTLHTFRLYSSIVGENRVFLLVEGVGGDFAGVTTVQTLTHTNIGTYIGGSNDSVQSYFYS